jgi:arsenate reductase-like glutaredoxin family protein
MIQLIGRQKCKNTKKAERFLKERKIDFHFLDMNKKELSVGELRNICRFVPAEDLIDKDSAAYKKKGYDYLVYDPEEEILHNQKLIKTPVLRTDFGAFAGFSESEYKKIAEKVKK